MQPGDVILLNDPHYGGSHLPDLTAFVPVFDGAETPALDHRARPSERHRRCHPWRHNLATEIFQEGLRVPPIKLYEAGKPRDDLLDLLALNIRNPANSAVDLAAMLGAAHLGERRVSKLFAEFGPRPSRPRSRQFSTPPSCRPAPWSRPGKTRVPRRGVPR